MRVINWIGLTVSLFSSGCIADKRGTYTTPPPQIDTSGLVGKNFWVGHRSIQVCPEAAIGPQEMPTGCYYYPPGKQFKVEEPAWNATAGYMSLRVSLPDGKSGFVTLSDMMATTSEAQKKKNDTEAANCKRRGGISIGMTKAQVLASCLGKPERVNSTHTARGTHEQWVYGEGTYVYLVNGVVTSAQQTTE